MPLPSHDELVLQLQHPRRTILQYPPTKGDVYCGGRFVRLDCGHLVVAHRVSLKRYECHKWASAEAVRIMLDTYLPPLPNAPHASNVGPRIAIDQRSFLEAD